MGMTDTAFNEHNRRVCPQATEDGILAMVYW